MDLGSGIYWMFAQRRLLFICRKRRVLHGEGERHRIRPDPYQHRMCFSVFCSKSGRKSNVILGCIMLQICGSTNACLQLAQILSFFSILVKPHPKPNPGNAIVRRSGCSDRYSSSSTNFHQDEDEAGVEPRGARNYNRPELTKHNVSGG